MKFTIKTMTMAIAISTLMACSSSDGDTDNSQMEANTVAQTDTGMETGTTQSGQTDADLLGSNRFALAECGSADVSTLTANSNSATSFVLGQVVEGQLFKDSADNSVENSDLWQITLEPGNYRLVMDSRRVSGQNSLVGIAVTYFIGNSEPFYFTETENDFDIRGHEYLEINKTETITLDVTQPFEGEMNYQLAIYADGSPVVSPRFTNCPDITRFSLDETQSFDLAALRGSEDYRWFQINLSAGDYFLDVSATSEAVDGVELIDYRFDRYRRFADVDYDVEIGSVTLADTTASSTFSIVKDDKSDTWIRVSSRNGISDRVLFTLRR